MIAIAGAIVVLLLVILSYMYFVHREKITADAIVKSVDPEMFEGFQPRTEKLTVDRITQYKIFNSLGFAHPRIYAALENVLKTANILDNFVLKSATMFGTDNVIAYKKGVDVLQGCDLTRKELVDKIVTTREPFVEEFLPVSFEMRFVVYWGRVILASVFNRGQLFGRDYGVVLRAGKYLPAIAGGNKIIDLYWCEMIWPELVKEVEDLAGLLETSRLTVDVIYSEEKQDGGIYYIGFGDAEVEFSPNIQGALQKIRGLCQDVHPQPSPTHP